ncbi:hypothetical protein HON86_03200 [Candidatus Woesearchaeota archaeon]|jgi:hypothetical protein|nr:hypothetical protein [Candidatus Woesearchaeota archaeon]MBT4835595.1 hypothetical protein [Candidatus Woesearchaeota archaeon]MBT6735201.1 hypothetical protein [Candidatus Woesearchaeota archaeon]MBT7169788.1 hypothetical protein [Candidatus Woesearchaeota archaeon]MBT7474457.1 hypothetical protein [Candidatus Woesearchaeota archaeon]
MKWFFILLIFVLVLFLVNFVSSDDCGIDTCGGFSQPDIFDQTSMSYNYCIRDSDCVQEFRITNLGSPVNFENWRVLGSSHRSELDIDYPCNWNPTGGYTFSAVDGCMPPSGGECVSPFYLNVDSSSGVITLPADTYPVGVVGVSYGGACSGGGWAEGFNWYNLNPFADDLAFSDPGCVADEPCEISIASQDEGRKFYGDVAVSGTDDCSNSLYLDQSEITKEYSDGAIRFTIPANTFCSGDIELKIYDLIDHINIEDQSGGWVSFVMDEGEGVIDPIVIEVSPNQCYIDQSCDITITVVEGTIDVDVHSIEFFKGDDSFWELIALDSGDVIINGNVISYTLPPNLVNVGEMNVIYSILSTLDILDLKTITMIESQSSTCIPDGCNDICPSYCTASDDPDCGATGCCGDFSIGLGEVCELGHDGSAGTSDDDLGGENCTSIPGGFDGGTLGCLDDCTFDIGGCYNNDFVCGDNIIQTPNDDGLNETCDGSANFSETCITEGFDDGTLSCLTDCTGFDPSDCSSPAPVVGPDEYIVYTSCEEDGDGNQYGVSNWTLYAGNGSQLNSSSALCILYSSEVPFSGIIGILLFLVVIFGFYYRENYQPKL